MSEKNEEKTLAQMLDDDKGFIASRRLLMTLSILLLVIVIGGVTIKEANTFIFKLEFVNSRALGWILLVAVFFCAVRYYAFAASYHQKIREIWKKKLIVDIRHDRYFKNQDGLLELILNPYDAKVSEIEKEDSQDAVTSPSYETRLFFNRWLEFYRVSADEYGTMGSPVQIRFINENWSLKDKMALFLLEIKYRLIAIFQHREYLDVLFPYLVAIVAMLSYFIAPHFINDSAQSVLTSFQLLCHPLDA